ncbi:MAG: tripartite tricarboxylate transporter substrate binding protein [Gammaproteobacteria bacterium]|nr:tripartite tricarboxylate transporter substrate binding protein [Gammaproteobacteria bacterium]
MLGALAVLVAGPAQAWEPKKPVEFIIMAGTGGGADQIARLLQGLIEKKGLSPRPFIPINKPGGSGAEALRYMQDKAGDDHTVMMTLNSFYTTPIIQPGLGVDPTKFTPIGLMAMDTFLLWVHTDRKDITDLDSYVKTVKSAGKNWKVGGTGSGQEDSVLEAGSSKPLVQFTGERMAAFPNVPTAKELGVNIEYYMQRSVNGPPGMSAGAVEFYTNLFQELFDSKEWQDFCVSDGLTCSKMLKGGELGEFHAKQYVAHEKLIAQVGAAAITGE